MGILTVSTLPTMNIEYPSFMSPLTVLIRFCFAAYNFCTYSITFTLKYFIIWCYCKWYSVFNSVLVFRKAIVFCMLTLSSAYMPHWLINSRIFCQFFCVFCTVISSVKKRMFLFNLWGFVYFSYLIALFNTSSMILQESVAIGCPCLSLKGWVTCFSW